MEPTWLFFLKSRFEVSVASNHIYLSQNTNMHLDIEYFLLKHTWTNQEKNSLFQVKFSVVPRQLQTTCSTNIVLF